MEEEVEYSLKGLLLRYFAHGVAFSILLTLLAVAWAFLLIMLVVVGWIIGLIIGFVLLFIIIGGLNAFLADLLWGIKVRNHWKTHLLHGFVLFLILLIIQLPAQLVLFVMPNIVTSAVIFIIAAFADGYVAKALALRLAGEEASEDESTD